MEIEPSDFLVRGIRNSYGVASLEHSNIARLLDGGSWIPPGGVEPQPYIVMEYVEGLPLTTYCTQEKLTVNQRLRLFRRVCDVLSYAHRQLVGRKVKISEAVENAGYYGRSI